VGVAAQILEDLLGAGEGAFSRWADLSVHVRRYTQPTTRHSAG
jgi:hypothetical protein